MAIDSQDNVIIFGQTSSSSLYGIPTQGLADFHVAKLSQNLTIQWGFVHGFFLLFDNYYSLLSF